jgi:hypothetical protein
VIQWKIEDKEDFGTQLKEVSGAAGEYERD